MKAAQDLIPWKVIDLGLRPFSGFWSMNPSVHFDGTWRCLLRCADYAMPGGVTIRSPKAGAGHQSKNAMVILDPDGWKPIHVYEMHERDDHPRTPSCPNLGFEDMRIFKTDRGGLQGIAAALHLKRSAPAKAGGTQHQPPEQVLLSFDDEYNIVKAQPIRGDGWSSSPQKNWSPFDGAAEQRFIFAIDKGRMFDDRGPVHGDEAQVRPSIAARPLSPHVPVPAPPPAPEPAPQAPQVPAPPKQPDRRTMVRGGGDVRIVRGGRMKLDASTSRPSARPVTRATSRPPTVRSEDAARAMGSGRALMPKYEGLRGGTQLVRVGLDTWLGIGHQMRFEKGLKLYWHVFFTVDSRGKMTAASEPMKLAPEGIEFAAGLAIDGDRAVVSFGVDDMKSMLGETSLSAVMGILKLVAGV